MAAGFSQCGAVSALTFCKNGLLRCLLLFVVCLIRAELCTFSVNSGPQGTACCPRNGNCKNVKGRIWAGSKAWRGLELCFWGCVLWLGMQTCSVHLLGLRAKQELQNM